MRHLLYVAFIIKVDYILFLLDSVLHCLPGTAFLSLDTAKDQIGSVNHFTVSDLDRRLGMCLRCCIGYFHVAVIVVIAFCHDLSGFVANAEAHVRKDFAVRDIGLGQLQLTYDGFVGEAYTSFVFHGYGFTVIPDLEIVVGVILNEAFGSSLFVEEVTAVAPNNSTIAERLTITG